MRYWKQQQLELSSRMQWIGTEREFQAMMIDMLLIWSISDLLLLSDSKWFNVELVCDAEIIFDQDQQVHHHHHGWWQQSQLWWHHQSYHPPPVHHSSSSMQCSRYGITSSSYHFSPRHCHYCVAPISDQKAVLIREVRLLITSIKLSSELLTQRLQLSQSWQPGYYVSMTSLGTKLKPFNLSTVIILYASQAFLSPRDY